MEFLFIILKKEFQRDAYHYSKLYILNLEGASIITIYP